MSNTIFTNVSEIEIRSKGVSEISNSQGEVIWRKTPLPEPYALKFEVDKPSTIELYTSIGSVANAEYSFSKTGPWTRLYGNPIMIPKNVVYVRGNNPNGFNINGSNQIVVDPINSADKISVKVSGNILSLLGENITDIQGDGCFRELFEYTKITDASELILANNVTEDCYYRMFYDSMLEIPPELPATILKNACYYWMFSKSKITKTPVLHANSIVTNAYRQMFENCANLSEVRCYATSLGGAMDTNKYRWLYGVAATGIFYKKRGVTWPSGANGIPTGWTVIEED